MITKLGNPEHAMVQAQRGDAGIVNARLFKRAASAMSRSFSK
jgi:hypothetical protein